VECGVWVGVNPQGLSWIIVVDKMVDGLCLELVSGGSKYCVVGAQVCSINSHGCLKGDMYVDHLYLLAGDGKGRAKPAVMIGWSVPIGFFGGCTKALAALNLDATEFNRFAELAHA
jgi:hypothetical protein